MFLLVIRCILLCVCMAEFVLMNFIFIFVHLIAFASDNICCLQFLWNVNFQDLIHRLFRNFPGYLETVWTIRKISRLSRNFPDHPETILTTWKLCKLSGNFPDYPENIQTIWKISSLSGNFPSYLETFQAIWKLSGSSRKYPGYPETFKKIRKISRLSGNFPNGPETSQCNFKGYAQKLSGWQCHDATMVFGPLHQLLVACSGLRARYNTGTIFVCSVQSVIKSCLCKTLEATNTALPDLRALDFEIHLFCPDVRRTNMRLWLLIWGRISPCHMECPGVGLENAPLTTCTECTTPCVWTDHLFWKALCKVPLLHLKEEASKVSSKESDLSSPPLSPQHDALNICSWHIS